MTKTREAPSAAIPIPLSAIRESRTNPRKTFDKDAMTDLLHSVQKHGVLQPVLVRPDKKNGKYEIVAGARRFRAAKAAKLTEIVATVRDLTDVEVLEIQVIENLQREDLHPMEEAEGYRILQERHGYGVEDLAAKVGKSKAYVYGRIKLTGLAPGAAKIFRSGRIGVAHAFLIARIPVQDLQLQAAKEISHVEWGDQSHPLSVAESRWLIERRYMMQLQEAPFDPKDATLVPEAGPCGSCPKRTGNDQDLFGDVKAKNMCTDPKCFEAKNKAHVERVLAEANQRGEPVLAGKRAERVLHGSTHVDLADNGHEIDWRKWRPALGRLVKELPVTRVLIAGRIHELVPRKDAVALLKKAGKIKKSLAPVGSRESSRDRKRSLVKKVATECLADIAAKAEALKNPKGFTRLVVEHLLRGRADGVKIVAKRREEPAIERDYSDTLRAATKRLLDGMTEVELRGLAVELIAADGIQWTGDRFPPGVVATTRLLGINPQARLRAATLAAAAKKAARKRKTKAKATRKKRPRKAARK